MQKQNEISRGDSCLNKALPDEMVFVLLARDPIAPQVIRGWCDGRVRAGLNKRDDAQIVEAEACADVMESQCLGLQVRLGKR